MAIVMGWVANAKLKLAVAAPSALTVHAPALSILKTPPAPE
jgi:hypothetical protein